MGLSIVTSVDKNGNRYPSRIFRNDKYNFPKYSIKVASKDKNDNWVNGYIDCSFPKGVELNNRTDIIIEDSFPIVTEGKDGRTYISWRIQKFTKINDGDAPAVDNGGFMDVPESLLEEMPFN